ncbi:MAG: GTP-binding protein [Bacteroidia bacterium]|nr:GTP-binding protein [Bacteroidia bacterium]
MASSPTPVFIVTGFLGAGKTSFLNHWIQHTPDERIMVIENEVGAENLDSQWLVGTDITPVPLTAGCLCCSLHDELIELLETLSRQRDTFDLLVIETTGVADPESLALPFLSRSYLEQHFKLQSILCLVDAGNFEHWLTQAAEAKRQVAFADALLVNKIDTLEETDLAKLETVLSEINPQAKVWKAEHGRFPVDKLKSVNHFEGAGAVEQYHHITEEKQANNHGISTFSFTFDQPLNVRGLARDLMKLLNNSRHQIYRIKAILNAHDYPVQIILQSVYNSFVLTDGLVWPEDEPKISKVVIIGKKLQKEDLKNIFVQHLLAKDQLP